MPTFAAVDIGANSVRLKIVRLVRNRMEKLAEDREVTRLGETVFRGALLSTDAMEHTVKVLRRFHRLVQEHGAQYVRVVGTSALREAGNAAAFLDWVHSATGWRVEIISGLEEGRLIHLAITSVSRVPHSARVLLFDLGGGSCELTLSQQGQIHYMVSLPLGAVRLTREFLLHDPPKRKEVHQLSEYITEEISRVQKRITSTRVRMAIATSGTAAALAGVWTSRRESKPTTVPVSAVGKLAVELAACPREQRAKMPGIGTRRAEIIVAGAMVFAELLKRLGLPSFRYSPLGLRDGLLAQMAADYSKGSRFQRQVESERRNALVSTGKQYGVDLNYAGHVRDLALALFAALQRLHQLPEEYEEWVAAAAMLHEVGSYVNRAGRHRHTYYLISNSELFGYTTEQRRIIASIARYVGQSRPSLGSRLMRMLPLGEQINVRKAVCLLRLAKALNQGRRGAVKGITVGARTGRVVLHIAAKRGGADLEIWAAAKERPYFRTVFGRELLLESP